MDFQTDNIRNPDQAVDLFTETFTTSEGAQEGQTIGALARSLFQTTPRDDVIFCSAHDGVRLCGALFFSRLTYSQDNRSVFVMGPVAVLPNDQMQGTGQRLIKHGLNALRRVGVDYAITYGDPSYYIKTGFKPITQEFAPAPYPLQYPEGWLEQPLLHERQTAFRGTATCVPAFRAPEYW